jgi:hypothetical protein
MRKQLHLQAIQDFLRDTFSSDEGLTHLDGTVNAATSVLEDVLECFAAGLGLVGDAAANEVALGVGGDLARDPDLAGGFDGLGLWVLLEMALGGLKSCLRGATGMTFPVKTYVVCHGCIYIVSNLFS